MSDFEVTFYGITAKAYKAATSGAAIEFWCILSSALICFVAMIVCLMKYAGK